MPTTQQDILSSVRTGINTNPAAGILQTLKNERRLLAPPSDSQEQTDKADDLKKALVYIQQAGSVIAAAGEAALLPHLQLLGQAWPTLPADDPTAGVVDQKKIRSRVRNMLTEVLALVPASPPAADTVSWLKGRVEDFKRRIIADHQNSDPCEALFAAARTAIAAAASQQSVDDAIATVQRLQHLLAP